MEFAEIHEVFVVFNPFVKNGVASFSFSTSFVSFSGLAIFLETNYILSFREFCSFVSFSGLAIFLETNYILSLFKISGSFSLLKVSFSLLASPSF